LKTRAGLALAGALCLPELANAHGFSALYNPPVPVWIYGWAAAATLIASFVVAGLLLTAPPQQRSSVILDLAGLGAVRALRRCLPALRLLGVLVLLLSIATGYWGSRDPARNFGMTFFWVIFALLFPYLTIVIGDFYAALNPWRTLGDALDRLWRGFSRGRLRYPAWLGDWPALALYLGFIGFELFGSGRPVSLANFLLGYTLLNLAGLWLIGRKAWFAHCEFFAVLLRLVALLSPVDYQRSDGRTPGRLRLRWPFAGLLHERPHDLSTLSFALAMLSTTAFDGLKATQWWVSLFWGDPTGLLREWLGTHPVNAMASVRPWFIAWEWLWLLASPFLYLGAYLGAIGLARWLTRSQQPLRELALDFAYALLPIAIVYHMTHYTALLFANGLKIISLVSDPFGRKWDLFGTAQMLRAPILPDYSVVWHTQVGLIVLGHIVSVVVAHRIALQRFPTRAAAMLSQLPMLCLMIAFTVAGLWILAQPLTAVLMR
jgi:hypothetical protein